MPSARLLSRYSRPVQILGIAPGGRNVSGSSSHSSPPDKVAGRSQPKGLEGPKPRNLGQQSLQTPKNGANGEGAVEGIVDQSELSTTSENVTENQSSFVELAPGPKVEERRQHQRGGLAGSSSVNWNRELRQHEPSEKQRKQQSSPQNMEEEPTQDVNKHMEAFTKIGATEDLIKSFMQAKEIGDTTTQNILFRRISQQLRVLQSVRGKLKAMAAPDRDNTDPTTSESISKLLNDISHAKSKTSMTSQKDNGSEVTHHDSDTLSASLRDGDKSIASSADKPSGVTRSSLFEHRLVKEERELSPKEAVPSIKGNLSSLEQPSNIVRKTKPEEAEHVHMKNAPETWKSKTKPVQFPKKTVAPRPLLEELFPEHKSWTSEMENDFQKDHPRLPPPNVIGANESESLDDNINFAKAIASHRLRREEITVLQLSHCSTGLMADDFRRLIPKAKNLPDWHRSDKDYMHIIPGRDPLSLKRLPFYYLLFKSMERALAYQKNASRLHKICALYRTSSILSAIPLPIGFRENGEDLNDPAVKHFTLCSPDSKLELLRVAQPYSPALRSLFDKGGYKGIYPNIDKHGKRIWKVLLQIEGYEPSPKDLFHIFRHDSISQGLDEVTLRDKAMSSIQRLRNVVELQVGEKSLSSHNPRPYGTFDHSPASSLTEHKPATTSDQPFFASPQMTSQVEGDMDSPSPRQLNQVIMNQVYNRWIVEFSTEFDAWRFAMRWHRRELQSSAKTIERDFGERSMINAEVLW